MPSERLSILASEECREVYSLRRWWQSVPSISAHKCHKGKPERYRYHTPPPLRHTPDGGLLYVPDMGRAAPPVELARAPRGGDGGGAGEAAFGGFALVRMTDWGSTS